MKFFKTLWAKTAPVERISNPLCRCLNYDDESQPWRELHLHAEEQDIDCPAWRRLNDLIEQVAADGREEFCPFQEMPANEWAQIAILPNSIAKLKKVKRFFFTGNLARIPPEIGEMEALEEFDAYMSYRLHWYPYEITRCRNLKKSAVSTRALYGNYKYRPPFPRLPQLKKFAPGRCSVCDGPFQGGALFQRWISLRVATDTMPLLVYACSEACIENLPRPPEKYVQHAHQGGLELEQPPARW